MSAAPPPPALPAGWTVASAADGQQYFYNTLTGETSWESPAVAAPPLRAGWEEVRNPADGSVYFYNATTGQSTWERPGSELDAEHENRKKLRRSIV